jgi:ABC-type bacteriocin/lantibiotic exporter with double-glycine peptidase domain
MEKASPIRVIKQRHNWDCGVACLAMILDQSYNDMILMTRTRFPKIPRRGLGIYHLEAIAVEFQRSFRRVYKSKHYLDNQPTGILGIIGGDCDWAGHWVVMKAGAIIEPWHETRAVYGLAEYLQESKCRTATLLVLEDK